MINGCQTDATRMAHTAPSRCSAHLSVLAVVSSFVLVTLLFCLYHCHAHAHGHDPNDDSNGVDVRFVPGRVCC